ncbi:MAG TPA: Fe-S protein assembly co-chaperone HscB [Ectothiorhodospiraceae bacterium]|nr:Fe-S protein assembly co-chaperone HscB [Ectothiorhodospiraceae bacterium]
MTLLGKNHFELFGLPVQFELDIGSIAQRYRELQRATHPDQFASGTEQEQRLAVQQAAQVNDAYQTIKSPLKRAQYLLQLKGNPLDETDTQMDMGFLMQQMEMREELENVPNTDDPFAALDKIRSELKSDLSAVTQLAASQLDGEGELANARESVKKMQFLYKVQQEMNELEEQLVEQL